MDMVKWVRFPLAVITRLGSTTVAMLLVIELVELVPVTFTAVADCASEIIFAVKLNIKTKNFFVSVVVDFMVYSLFTKSLHFS